MSDGWEWDPCPECGSTELDQLIESWERVQIRNGDMAHVEPLGDSLDVKRIECAECGHVIVPEEEP